MICAVLDALIPFLYSTMESRTDSCHGSCMRLWGHDVVQSTMLASVSYHPASWFTDQLGNIQFEHYMTEEGTPLSPLDYLI